MNPRAAFNRWADGWRADWVRDLETPDNLRRAWFDMMLFDHGFIRALTSNFAQITNDAWRSNQPSPKQLQALAARGLASIINVRGTSEWGSYHLERREADRLGLPMFDVRLFSRTVPAPQRLAQLFEAFDAAPRPLLIHCKSGADRAGIASAIYMLDYGKGSPDEARAQLHWRFGHFRSAPTGILDATLDRYLAEGYPCGMRFRDWAATRMDADAIRANFRARGLSGLITDRILGRE